MLLRWLVSTLAIGFTAFILPGVSIESIITALIVALVLGLVNAVLKPLLIFFTLPLTLLTLGLFTFVIDALLILLVSKMVPGFAVDGFWWALLFSLIIAIVNAFLKGSVRAVDEETADEW